VQRIARTEPTLRDMLQQFRHLFDHLIYGESEARTLGPRDGVKLALNVSDEPAALANRVESVPNPPIADPGVTYSVKSVAIVHSPHPSPAPAADVENKPQAGSLSASAMLELWAQEERSARRKLEPDGALTGATRELQAGLGALLQACLEHGVKVGPWRLQHVVPEFTFSEHPTYGVMSIAHWACKDGEPWKVGVGLFLSKAAGKPRDLEVKLSAMQSEPAVIDHLILLRPEDDLSLTGKSKHLWQEAEKRGSHARLEPVDLDGFATLYSFPRWLAALTEAFPDGQPLPNLADMIQERCEKLLEQVCMPVQG
jgi:hypothetical protein